MARMASEPMIPDSEESDIEVDEYTTATQFVQARSASVDIARSLRSPSLVIDGEPARCSEGRGSFSSTGSHVVMGDMAPIGVIDEAMLGDGGVMDVDNVQSGGTNLTET